VWPFYSSLFDVLQTGEEGQEGGAVPDNPTPDTPEVPDVEADMPGSLSSTKLNKVDKEDAYCATLWSRIKKQIQHAGFDAVEDHFDQSWQPIQSGVASTLEGIDVYCPRTVLEENDNGKYVEVSDIVSFLHRLLAFTVFFTVFFISCLIRCTPATKNQRSGTAQQILLSSSQRPSPFAHILSGKARLG
jgi:hypothetical protein